MNKAVEKIKEELEELSEIAGQLAEKDGCSWAHFEKRLYSISQLLEGGYYMTDSTGRHHYAFITIKDIKEDAQ